MGVTPYVAGTFVTFALPAYAEKAVSRQRQVCAEVCARSVTDARSELGIRTDKSVAMPTAFLTLRGRLAWGHDFDLQPRRLGRPSGRCRARASSSTAPRRHSDSALATAAIERKWTNGWSAVAAFKGEFSNVTRSYAGKGVVRYAW